MVIFNTMFVQSFLFSFIFVVLFHQVHNDLSAKNK